MSEEQIRRTQLDMLQFVHEICEKNNLRYYLCGGSLIGAVRHNGFIPWDDDIDIDMPREDYMRFKNIISVEKKYKLLTYDSDTKYDLAFGKLMDTNTVAVEHENDRLSKDWGIYIDIFPIDGLPKYNYEKYFYILLQISNLLTIANRNEERCCESIMSSVNYLVKKIISKVMGVSRLKRILSQMSQKYSFDSSNMVCCVGGGYGMKEIYPRYYFDKRILADFEGKKYYIPAQYDAFLTQMYGDYMKLPPEEERKAHHGLKAYVKD